MAPAPRTSAAAARRRPPRTPKRAADDDVVYFADLLAWRTWLARHHADRAAQWVGFYKRGSGIPSITWPESVDDARARRDWGHAPRFGLAEALADYLVPALVKRYGSKVARL